MSFVLLVNTAFKTSDRNEFFQLSPPLGLLAISAALEEASISVELIDPQISEDYENQVREAVARRPFFVGMTTFMGPNILNAQNLTNLVHECDSNVPVIWGGPLATSSPDLCFDQSTVDYIVLGMGEDTVVSLVDTLKEGGDPGSLPHVLGKDFQELSPKTVPSSAENAGMGAPRTASFPRWSIGPIVTESASSISWTTTSWCTPSGQSKSLTGAGKRDLSSIRFLATSSTLLLKYWSISTRA
jgi:hypothetical protein